MARFIIIFILTSYFGTSFAQTGKLIVVVKGVQPQKGGELSTGIFINENFPKVGKQLLGNETAVTSSEMKIVFDNVPPGTYGVVSFHDIDKNKQLKSNLVGYPTEPIGFSRDARIKFGPPDFDDARITIEKDQTLTVIIILR
jgi:uncharacterized protein (DUF2141 family)